MARDKDVKLIALSIGGNDLGFASIVTACVEAYATNRAPCETTQGPGLTAKFPRRGPPWARPSTRSAR